MLAESAIFWKLQQIARGSVQMKRDTAVKMLDFKVLKSIDGELNFGGYPWTCPRALKLFLAPMLKTVGMVGWSAGDVTVGLRDVLDSGTTAGCPELDNLYLPVRPENNEYEHDPSQLLISGRRCR